jgi:hypothetical protein
VGAEIVPLVKASLTWFEVGMVSADELETICLEDYLDVLRDAGWAGIRQDVESVTSHPWYFGAGLARPHRS